MNKRAVKIVQMRKLLRRRNVTAYQKAPRLCARCQEPIPYDKRRVKRFCSKSCAMTSRNTEKRLINGIICCLLCHKEITQNRLKRQFCSRRCAFSYQWLEFVRKLEANGRIEHNKTQVKYLTFKHGHKCFKCGKKTFRGEPILLDVHHLSGDHSDNSISNLALFCVYCHYYHHRREIWRGERQTYT